MEIRFRYLDGPLISLLIKPGTWESPFRESDHQNIKKYLQKGDIDTHTHVYVYIYIELYIFKCTSNIHVYAHI